MNGSPKRRSPTWTALRSTLRARWVFGIRLALAVSALIALLLDAGVIAGVLLVPLIALLLITPPASQRADAGVSLQAPSAPTPPSTADDLTRLLSTTLSIAQVGSIVLQAAQRAVAADEATLAIPMEGKQFLAMQLAPGEEQVQMAHRSPSRDSLIAKVIERGQTTFSRDRMALAVVLRHEYLIVGALYVESQTRAFTSADTAALDELASPAAISLHNAHMLDDQQYQINTLNHIQALTLRLASVVDEATVARGVLETTRDLLGVQEVALYRVGAFGLTPILSLHRERFTDSPGEKRLTAAVALTAAQSGSVETLRQPVGCIAVPVAHGGTIREVLAVAFIENQPVRRRDADALTLIASQTAEHLNAVELHQQVRAVSERLRVTIESSRDGVLLLDQNGSLIECNLAAEQLLGIQRSAFLGKQFVDLLAELMNADDANGLGYTRADLPELMYQMPMLSAQITRRQVMQITAGQRYFIEEIGSPVFDADRQIIGRLLVLHDVTEQKLLADFRDQITHMAVHDLRGPLSAVINGIDMTLRLGLNDHPEDNERILRLSLDSARSLVRLIDSLLDIAKLESRQMPIKAQPVMALELILSATQMLANSITQAHVEVETRIADELPMLYADLDLMRRVLINLIDNAIRFSPEGGKIMVTARQTGAGEIMISVADSGAGIPPEDRDLVFEQYRQSGHQPLRGSKGTGLGLTFCKLAVEAHGGRISITSSEDVSGACFVINLPVVSNNSGLY